MNSWHELLELILKGQYRHIIPFCFYIYQPHHLLIFLTIHYPLSNETSLNHFINYNTFYNNNDMFAHIPKLVNKKTGTTSHDRIV